jgi:ribonuclease-3
MTSDLSSLEAALGFTIHQRDLLRQAFIHRSYVHENPEDAPGSNERLEFLGDAVLGFVIADYIYRRYPEMSEGELTSLRAAVVKASVLARLAVGLQLGNYLFLSKGEESSGGRERPTILAGAFEALIGVVFIDQGLEAARSLILRLMVPLLEDIVAHRLEKDAKSRLQELVQGLWATTPTYRTVEVQGPDHDRTFTVEVIVGGRVLGRGTGKSKQAAEQQAAHVALETAEQWGKDNPGVNG